MELIGVYVVSNELNNENINQENMIENQKVSKVKKVWNKFDLFSKILIIISLLALLFLLVAIGSEVVLSVALSIVSIAGIGITMLVHKEKIQSDKKWLKYLLVVGSVLFVALSAFASIDSIDSEIVHKVETPFSAEYCKDKNYETIISDFESMGFTNISEEPMEDLELSESEKYGHVESVTINGITDFEGNTRFKSNVKIIVKYHSYKCSKAPFSSEEAECMETNAIIEALEKAGFVNITTNEVYDLDPDKIKAEFENEVSIDESYIFEKNEKFPLDSEIEIVTHRPYEKYTLKLSIDFVENLMFSKYDVDFELNGETKTLEHGKDEEFEYRLKKGEYTLYFYSTEDSSVSSSVSIDLTGDTNASYKIYCYSEKIVVDTIFVENKGAVGENQAMVPTSASDCMFENYKDIEKDFKKAGFTNIKTKILYDIYWGWTEEGEVDSVTINGDDDFIRGDIYDKDSKIVITYHMKEEDDPNKPVETTEVDMDDDEEPEETETSDEEDEDTPVFYSTNTRKTVSNGDSGVYAYKSKGGLYDIYWIIDFDNNYVYYFTDGNGDTTCDRLKIESGNLNSVVIITYHDGADEWSNGLHFKYKEHSEHLVMQDNDGFEYDYYTTDLSDALLLRNSKTIVDY